MDYSSIILEDFLIEASVGIYEGDDKIKTPLSVSLSVWIDLDPIKYDKIDETMCYEVLANLVRNSTKTHYHLLEYLAEHYCEQIFKHPRAQKIDLKILKTKVFPEGAAGIQWSRSRK